MNFKKLHKGLGCSCLDFAGVAENMADCFARRVRNAPPQVVDFRSYNEEGKEAPRDSTPEVKCKYRGVSIYRVDSSNEDALKEAWADEVKIKPRSSSTYCKFRLRSGAGMVWLTPSSSSRAHCTLLKCDTFGVTNLDIVEVESLV